MTLEGFLRGPLAPAIIAVCIIAATFEARSRTGGGEPPARLAGEETAYTEEARQLLSDLEVGDVLDGSWRVTRIRGPVEGHVAVEMEREGALLEVRILRKGTSDANAPLSTERFDLHYVLPHPEVAITPESLRAGLQSLSERITEDAAVPPGM